MKHKRITAPNNPYATLFAKGDVIPDHNGIWGESVAEVIESIVNEGVLSDDFEHVYDNEVHWTTCPELVEGYDEV